MSSNVLRCPMMSAFGSAKMILSMISPLVSTVFHLFNSVLLIKIFLIYLLTAPVLSDMIQLNYEVNIRNEVKYYGFVLRKPKNTAQNVYTNMRPYLAQKDGAVHVVLINSFSQLANQVFKCDEKYTTEIDYVLNCMQREGYEILDIKFNSIPNQGMTGNRTGFNTLITYR